MDCQVIGCKKEASAIIRTKDVCKHCFNWIKNDNTRKIKQEEDITTSLKVQKRCLNPECRKTYLEVPKYDPKTYGRLPLKALCSKDCAIAYKQLKNKYTGLKKKF